MEPTLVLLPGLDGTAKLFRRVRSVIGEEFETVALGYPADPDLGYVELAAGVRERLPEAGSVVLVAESFSGPLSVAVAADPTCPVAAVVLCNSFVVPPVPSWLRIAPLEWVLSSALPDSVLRGALLGPKASEALCDEVRATIRSVPAAVLAARVREVLRTDMREALAKLRCPVLDLRSDADRLVRARAARVLRATSDVVETATVPGPHLVLQAEPASAWSEIGSFLRRRLAA